MVEGACFKSDELQGACGRKRRQRGGLSPSQGESSFIFVGSRAAVIRNGSLHLRPGRTDTCFDTPALSLADLAWFHSATISVPANLVALSPSSPHARAMLLCVSLLARHRISFHSKCAPSLAAAAAAATKIARDVSMQETQASIFPRSQMAFVRPPLRIFFVSFSPVSVAFAEDIHRLFCTRPSWIRRTIPEQNGPSK